MLDIVQKEAFDAALVDNDLLEAGKADNSIGNAVRSANNAIRAGVLASGKSE